MKSVQTGTVARMTAPSRDDEPDYSTWTFEQLAAASDEALYGQMRREHAERVAKGEDPWSREIARTRPHVRRFLILSAIAIGLLIVLIVLTTIPWPGVREGLVATVITMVITVVLAVAAIVWMLVSAFSPRRPGIRMMSESSGDSWRAAEEDTARWLLGRSAGVHLGSGSRDGGVDVNSNDYVVQVKRQKGNVGAPVVRQIHGVAAVSGKTGVVVSHGSGFTPEAIRFAQQAGVELYVANGSSHRRINR